MARKPLGYRVASHSPRRAGSGQDYAGLARQTEWQIDQLNRTILALVARNGRLEQRLDRRLAELERNLETSLAELLQQGLASLFGGSGAAVPLGDTLASALVPRFARGGIVDGAQLLALGGEAGPEAVLPLSRGSDGRLGVRLELPAAMASARQTTVLDAEDMAATPGGPPADPLLDPENDAALAAGLERALGAALDQAIAERLQEQLRDGGLLAPLDR